MFVVVRVIDIYCMGCSCLLSISSVSIIIISGLMK